MRPKNNNLNRFWSDRDYVLHWFWSSFLPPILAIIFFIFLKIVPLSITIPPLDLFVILSFILLSILLLCLVISLFSLFQIFFTSVFCWLDHPLPWLISIISYVVFVYFSLVLEKQWFLVSPAISWLRCFTYSSMTWLILSYVFYLSPLFIGYDQIVKKKLSRYYTQKIGGPFPIKNLLELFALVIPVYIILRFGPLENLPVMDGVHYTITLLLVVLVLILTVKTAILEFVLFSKYLLEAAPQSVFRFLIFEVKVDEGNNDESPPRAGSP